MLPSSVSKTEQKTTNPRNIEKSDLVMLFAKEKWFCASSFYLCKIHFEILETRHSRF